MLSNSGEAGVSQITLEMFDIQCKNCQSALQSIEYVPPTVGISGTRPQMIFLMCRNCSTHEEVRLGDMESE